MKYSIKFTETAKSDLRDIAVYIVEESKDKSIAENFVRKLIERCSLLEDFPQSGALPKDRVLISGGYRFIVYDEYLACYIVDDASLTVYVQAVFNAKKDYTRVLKKML